MYRKRPQIILTIPLYPTFTNLSILNTIILHFCSFFVQMNQKNPPRGSRTNWKIVCVLENVGDNAKGKDFFLHFFCGSDSFLEIAVVAIDWM